MPPPGAPPPPSHVPLVEQANAGGSPSIGNDPLQRTAAVQNPLAPGPPPQPLKPAQPTVPSLGPLAERLSALEAGGADPWAEAQKEAAQLAASKEEDLAGTSFGGSHVRSSNAPVFSPGRESISTGTRAPWGSRRRATTYESEDLEAAAIASAKAQDKELEDVSLSFSNAPVPPPPVQHSFSNEEDMPARSRFKWVTQKSQELSKSFKETERIQQLTRAASAMLAPIPDVPQNNSSDAVLNRCTLDEAVCTTIMRDLRAVGFKMWYVMLPSSRHDGARELKQWDLWGPLILCLVLAWTLERQARDVEASEAFSTIFVVVWIGSGAVTANSVLLGGKVHFFQTVCVLGYCLTPLVAAAVVCGILDHNWITLPAVCTSLFWATGASVGFLADLVPEGKRGLAVYPVWLFYVAVSWLILVTEIKSQVVPKSSTAAPSPAVAVV